MKIFFVRLKAKNILAIVVLTEIAQVCSPQCLHMDILTGLLTWKDVCLHGFPYFSS